MGSRCFPAFPKARPVLPEAFKSLYERYYIANREGQTTATTGAKALEAWMHRKVSEDLVRGPLSRGTARTLEIGAGTLNHVRHEGPPVGGAYDIVEPFRALFEGSELMSRVRDQYDDVGAIAGEVKYDRIISIATFEHLLDLPRVIAIAARHLDEGATMRVAIPSEGSIAWRLGWTLTTGLEFRLKYGLDYGVLMRHEHVNSWREIRRALEHFFVDVKASAFGLSAGLSFYQFYECRSPSLTRCEALLDEWTAHDAAAR
ncbi:MAG: hypothetical protein KF819_30575 [Labilithrix sp.]|nr:hypothetical protein [Labilithrix sp.]